MLRRLRPLPRALLALPALLALLALGGCLRLEGEMSVNGADASEPDTVSGTMLIAVSDEWAIAQGQDPTSISDAIVDELAASPGSGLTGEPFDDGEVTGATLTLTDVPLERLSTATDGALRIEADGGDYVLRGDLSELNATVEGEDPDAVVPWTAQLAVTFPADVTDHNGTLDGRTVSWDLDQTSADPTVFATSGGGQAPSWISRVPVPLIVLVVLAGIGAAVAFVLGRRQRADGTSAEAPGAGGEARGGGGGRGGKGHRTGSSAKLDDVLDRDGQGQERARGDRPPGGRNGGAGRGRTAGPGPRR